MKATYNFSESWTDNSFSLRETFVH